MDENLSHRAELWLGADPDPGTAEELRDLIASSDEAALRDRLDTRLEFGTAGLRGVLGAGPNRMNRAVIRQTTAGLARYVLSRIPDATRRGVVVGRDARRMSDVFARETAAVLAAHGIPALVFPTVVPTPLVAFATDRLGAAAGVMVTASHNPPEYNGYKVYWENGAQIVPPHDAGISASIDAAGPADRIPLLAEGQARASGLWRGIGPEVLSAYREAIAGLVLHPGAGRETRIVYTAMHGVGGPFTCEALAASGFDNVFPVPEQQEPDGSFPTVRFPNPEEPGALDLALGLAARESADLVLANDPDADRLAVAARDGEGKIRVFSGNEIGVLLGHYCLTQRPPGTSRPLVLATIVSSSALGGIARDLGARYEETLTGFKWIMNRALAVEEAEGLATVFAYEEALGYCVGQVVRDKDGISAALVFADLAAWCRSRGLTPWGLLEEIQRRHGLFLSAQKSVTLPGRDGKETIAGIMAAFRSAPPAAIGGLAVTGARDYLRGTAVEGGVERPLGLPPSNVLSFQLAGGSRVTLRPSGTEPKLKYYFELRENPAAGEPLAAATKRGNARLEELVADFVSLARERGQPA